MRREEARLKKGEGQEDPLPEEPSWDLPAELQVHRSLTHTPPDVQGSGFRVQGKS